MRRAFLIALLLYTSFDFANPLLPGAVNFDDDQTVLATGAGPRDLGPGPLSAPARTLETVRVDGVEPPQSVTAFRVPARRQPSQFRRSYPGPTPSPGSTEDH